ncbi:MAG: hypothetical protein JO353_09235 [Phycisphaerae bacterium]|nr:hypothetical protein [Phycisphaerae bacterium]
MIKSLIILLLLIIVCGGAALSRPSQQSFIDFYTDRATSGGGGLTAAVEKEAYARYAESFTYSNNILWSTEEKNGKTVFLGVFSHWFTQDEANAKPGETLKSLLK